MSSFGKLLAPFVVPAGGWDFTFKQGETNRTVTIPAGTYATILELLDELEEQLDTSYTPTVTCSSVGIVRIAITEMTAMNWALTSSGFAQLGFTGTEAVVSNSITSDEPHDRGWYPGTITHGAAGGVGYTGDEDWQAEHVTDGVVSGAGQLCNIGPARPPYRRTLTFGAILREEMRHKTRGPVRLRDTWGLVELRWYPDRDVGSVARPGSQGDPGDPHYDTDDSCDYWTVRVDGETRLTPAGSFPDYFTVSVTFNAEPIVS